MDLFILELTFNFTGKEEKIYPVILRNTKETVLVDCGYAGFLPLIARAAQQNGILLDELTGIIITHHDMDHMGGLYEIKAKYPDIKVYASEIEARYISGQEKSLRLEQAEKLFEFLPAEQKPGALAFQDLLTNVQPVAVDATFPEQNSLSFLAGVEIIATPGHMPGHISLYLPESKTLIAADAVVFENGELDIANPNFTLDLPTAISSVKKLQFLEINKMVCYHGGLVEDNIIPERLSNLVSRYA